MVRSAATTTSPSHLGPLGLGHAETAALLTAVAREPCAWVNGGFTDQLINTTIQPYLTQVTQARGKQYRVMPYTTGYAYHGCQPGPGNIPAQWFRAGAQKVREYLKYYVV